MRNLTKRGLSFVIVLALCVSLLSGMVFTANAASYVANWGSRGVTANELSDYATDFYTGNYTYDNLSVLAGSSSTDSVPSSALFSALHTLMYSNLTDYTSYDETTSLFKYTDCENGDTTSISSFYSGKAIGPNWDSGSTWNREHTWPNSKSNGGSDSNTRRETDIMMLRPTATTENGSRGNTAYGTGSNYFNPNSASSTLDLRGDVSRTVLYVYVCWGGSSSYHDGALNYMWGSSGVIESKDVLLAWMEADPVDTWEMGRNDAVQSITGTRNVFVDYPELAFQLFNEEVPANYPTPSGEGGTTVPTYTITAQTNNAAYGTVSLNGSVITATPAEGYYADDYVVTSGTATVTQNGNKFTVNAGSDCTVKINFAKKATVEVEFSENNSTYNYQDVYQNEPTVLPEPWEDAPEGWEFAGWVTEGYSETETKPTTIYKAGDEFTATDDVTLYALYTRTEGGSGIGANVTFEFGANGSATHVDGSNYGTSKTFTEGGSTLSLSNMTNVFGPAYDAKGNSAIKLGTSSKTGTFTFTVPDGVSSVIINAAKYKSNTSKITINGTAYTIGTNSNDGTYTAYTVDTSTTKTITFATVSGGVRCMIDSITYVSAGAGKTYYATVTCVHEDSGLVEGTPADCETEGYTDGVYCNDCEKYISGHTVIPATGHDYSYVVTLPTATEKGYTTYTCDNCGDSYTKNETDALGEVNYGPLSENTPYHLKMVQVTAGKTLYFTGVMSGEYLATSESEDDAVEVYMEKVESEGVRFYFVQDGAKKYIEIYIKTGTTSRPRITDTPSVVYTYNTEAGEYVVLLAAGEYANFYYLGAYNSNTTIGASSTYYITGDKAADKGKTQFCAEFVTFCAHSETTTTTVDPTCTETGLETVTCNACEKVIRTTVLEAKGHSWDNGKIVPPTAIAQGYTLYTCSVCKETKQENFTESTDVYVTFVTPAGVTLVPAIKLEGNAVTLPTANVPDGTVEYTFVGWSEVQIDNAADYTGTILAAGSEQNFTEATTLYAAYSYVVETEGEAGESKEIVFELGANGTATHNDGKEITTSKSYTADGYTLTIASPTKTYSDAIDAKGNSAIKLGTSKVVGGFSFTVPDDVSSVIIYVAKYKSNTTKISINGGATQTVPTNSDNGSYTAYTVDTSTSKTVSITTVSGGIRAMINSITYVIPGKATEPMITTYTTTEIGEACEHSATTSTIVEPSDEAVGSLTVTCDDCGATVRYIVIEKAQEPAEFEFSGASLSIENGISVNFKADARLFNEQGYSAPYATFQLMNKTFTAEGVDNGKGQYVFTLYNIQPDWMGELITATLTATLDGEQVSADPIGYSVATYCYNMLNDAESSESLKRLMVDVLNYGAASQAYTGHMAEYPVNGDLNEEQKALATAYTAPESVLNVSNEITGETVVWQGISLFLRETANIRVRFTSDITEGLSLKGTICDQTYTVDQEDFLQSGNNYYVYFDHIPVYQMRKEITFLVCQNNGGVSEMLTYSVASYAAAMMENSELAPLMQAMLCYGDSAAAYVAANG